MGSISSIGAAFGYTNSVLAYDDTLPAAPPTSTSTPAPAAVSAPVHTTATAMASATTAQKVDLGNLTLEAQMASALFATAPTATDTSSVFFGGAAMAGLLNSQGTAAMKYLTPPAVPTPGSIVNASA